MSADQPDTPEVRYGAILLEYCTTHEEEALYQASILSEDFIRAGTGPDEIVACHFDAVQRLLASEDLPPANRVRAMADAHQFLLEVMIIYGAKYREYLDLKLDEAMRTAEMRLAFERQRAEDAERAQEEKLEILAGIAHELSTPITIAKGNVSVADRMLRVGNTLGVPPLLGEASSALDRLSYLTGQLVSASQDEAPNIEMEPLNLLEVASKAARWAAPAAKEQSLNLEQDFDDGKVFIEGNGDALLTVFANLLSNAIRYTPPGGNVAIRCHNGADEVLFEVSDTGIGMTDEVKSRIFEKFYRGPESRKLSGSGLGMGLVIAQRLIEAHHARLEVESTPGTGSTFRVHFPAWHPEEAIQAIEAGEEPK